MPSIQARLMNIALRALNAKKMFIDIHTNANNSERYTAVIHKNRAQSNQHDPAARIQKKYDYQKIDINGFSLHRFKKGSPKKVLIFLHGGAYIVGPSMPHWSLVDKLAEQLNYEVVLFDYPKAPENCAKETIKQTEAIYDILLAEYGAENIFLMGGSAGAGLAAGFLMHLKGIGKSQPAHLILLYPWLDVTMSHPESEAIESRDLLLKCDGLRTCGELYAGEYSLKDPIISPIYGSWEGLPPVQIFTGINDILNPQAKALEIKLKSINHPVGYFEYVEMQHAWMILPIPEAKQAINQLVNVVR